jgi:hypothetical protein
MLSTRTDTEATFVSCHGARFGAELFRWRQPRPGSSPARTDVTSTCLIARSSISQREFGSHLQSDPSSMWHINRFTNLLNNRLYGGLRSSTQTLLKLSIADENASDERAIIIGEHSAALSTPAPVAAQATSVDAPEHESNVVVQTSPHAVRTVMMRIIRRTTPGPSPIIS